MEHSLYAPCFPISIQLCTEGRFQVILIELILTTTPKVPVHKRPNVDITVILGVREALTKA